MGKKVVLDTNVFISAFGWQGASREIFKGCIDGDLELFIFSHSQAPAWERNCTKSSCFILFSRSKQW